MNFGGLKPQTWMPVVVPRLEEVEAIIIVKGDHCRCFSSL